MSWCAASVRIELMHVALAHDYLTQRGGAERVALVLAEAFDGAPLYVSCYEPSQTFPQFARCDVRTTWIDKVRPLRRDPRYALPVLAPTFSFQKIDADVVIASSSGWAHGIGTAAPVVVYCHTPARWLYQPRRYTGMLSHRTHALGLAATTAARVFGPPLRRWDARAAHRAVTYIANSRSVATQIREQYGIDAELLPPPPALDSLGPQRALLDLEPGFNLTVSRLLPYKNVDLILEVARQRRGEQFVLVGDGPLRHEVERLAPPNIRLLNNVGDDELRWLYANAVALVAPSFEDFGLTPLEAASLGTPTAALRAGGYLDTVADPATGAYFDTPDPIAIGRALDDLRQNPRRSEDLTRHAAAFGRERFIERMQTLAREAAER